MSLAVLRAGAAYFVVVLASGFVLGTLRTLFVAPQVGEINAVVMEVPVMLAIAWFACGWVLSSIKVPQRAHERIAVGAIALALLLAAEALISVALAGKSLQEHLQSYAHAAPLIGLGAQLLYGVFPLIRSHRLDAGPYQSPDARGRSHCSRAPESDPKRRS